METKTYRPIIISTHDGATWLRTFDRTEAAARLHAAREAGEPVTVLVVPKTRNSSPAGGRYSRARFNVWAARRAARGAF